MTKMAQFSGDVTSVLRRKNAVKYGQITDRVNPLAARPMEPTGSQTIAL